MSNPRIELLLVSLSRAFEGKSWHGPTLKGTLRGVTLKTAGARYGKARNSIRDLVYHCAYWKYIVRGWVNEAAGKDRGPKFPRSPANFPDPEEKLTEKQWKADRQTLNQQHRLLVAAVKALPPGKLDRSGIPGAPTFQDLILGVAAHDLYHAGQISLLKRLG
ncbi:MAG: DinB family protein [Planctomycetes bacterium]|nr:DinB family protein [Planctomycetota bacterium]